MAEEIIDVTSCVVTPVLIYLGTKGITPRVLAVEGEEILTLQKVQGPRLGQLLESQEFVSPQADEVYVKLGTAVATISRYGLVHGHLHSYNVVVEQGRPIVIDWEQASYFPGNPTRDFGGNLVMLLEDLRKSKRSDKTNLESLLINSFDGAILLPAEKSYAQMEIEASPLLYKN